MRRVACDCVTRKQPALETMRPHAGLIPAVPIATPPHSRVPIDRYDILKQYFEQNITQQQLREELSLALTDEQLKRDDPLKPFSEVCRNELRALQNAL